MSFKLKTYQAPDFTQPSLMNAPEARLEPAPFDKVAPDGYHATTIFPEYFKVGSQWLLAEESRMDCVAVFENGKIHVREFRNLKKGDLVFTGRKESLYILTASGNWGRTAWRRRGRHLLSGRAGQGKRHFRVITITSMNFWNMRRNTAM